MNVILAIAKRELNGYFQTVVGWLSLLGFVSVTGLIFCLLVADATDPSYFGQEIDVNEMFIPAFFHVLAVLLLLLSPAMSMRIFSEEYQQGSFPLLLSSPIRSEQIIFGKFLGTLGYLGLSFLATVHCAALLFWFATPSIPILLVNYLALILCASTFFSIGMFASSLTKNQLVALSLSFSLLLSLWFLGSLGDQYAEGPKALFAQLSPLPHLETLSKGLLRIEDISYFVLCSAFFLYLTHQKIESLRWQKEHWGSQVFGIVVIGLFCSSLQYVATQEQTSWDLTASQRYTLSTQSVSILSSLEKEITIRAYFSADSSDRLSFLRIADGIKKHTDQINIEIIDPNTEALRAKQDDITVKYGTIIVESGTHTQRIEHHISEENIINTIVQVNAGTKHRICFSTGLDEVRLEDPYANESMGSIYQALTAQNYDAMQVSWLLPDIPLECEVFIVVGPRQNIPPSQIERLKRYLETGGHIFLLIDPITQPDFTAALAPLGLQIGDNFIIENNLKYQIQGGDPSFVILDEESAKPHPMFRLNNQTLLLQGLRSVESAPSPQDDFQSVELLYTSQNSWAESRYLDQEKAPTADPEEDLLGPVPIMALSTLQKESKESAHLLFLGSSTIVLNEVVSVSPANQDFFLNIIAWLVNEEAQINQRAVDDQTATIRLNQAQYLAMWIICLLIAPLSALSGAFSAWRERQRA